VTDFGVIVSRTAAGFVWEEEVAGTTRIKALVEELRAEAARTGKTEREMRNFLAALLGTAERARGFEAGEVPKADLMAEAMAKIVVGKALRGDVAGAEAMVDQLEAAIERRRKGGKP
jgi:hypothetical protein